MSASDSEISSCYDWNSDDEPPQERNGDERTLTSDKQVMKRVIQSGVGYDRPGRADRVLIQWGPSEDELGEQEWINLGKRVLPCGVEIALRQMRKGETCEVSFPEGGAYSAAKVPVFNKGKRYLPMAPQDDAILDAELKKLEEKRRLDEMKEEGKIPVTSRPEEMGQPVISVTIPQCPNPKENEVDNKELSDDMNKEVSEDKVEGSTVEPSETSAPPSPDVIEPKIEDEEEEEIPRTRYVLLLHDYKTYRRLTDDGRVLKETLKEGIIGRRPADDDFVTYEILNSKLEVMETHEKKKICELPVEIFKPLRSMRIEEVAKVKVMNEKGKKIYLRLVSFHRLNLNGDFPKLELKVAPDGMNRIRGDLEYLDVCFAISTIPNASIGFDHQWPAPKIIRCTTAVGTMPKEIESAIGTMALLEDSIFEIPEITPPTWDTIPDQAIPPCKDMECYDKLQTFVKRVFVDGEPLREDNPPPLDWHEEQHGTPSIFPKVSEGPCLMRIWLVALKQSPETWEMDGQQRTVYIALTKRLGNKYVEGKDFERAQSAYEHALDALRFEVSELFESDPKSDPKNAIRALPTREPATPEEVNLYMILHCNIAFCATQLQNYHHAHKNANKALAKDADCVKGLFRRALAYEGMGDFNKALADFGRLLQLAPTDPAVKAAITRLNTKSEKQTKKDTAMCKKMFE